MSEDTVGILTFAFGREYQLQAYCQTLTAKKNLGDMPVSVVVAAGEPVDPKLKSVANIIPLKGKWATFEYEQLALDLTPYDLTYKTDADVLYPRGATLYHGSNLAIASGVATDIRGLVSLSTAYRPLETSLGTPVIYSACFTFNKHSGKAQEFFAAVKDLYRDWYRLKLWDKTEKPLPPTTDTVYSLAWMKVFGLSRVDGNEFIHAKPEINGWTDGEWTKNNVFMLDDNGRMFLNGVRLCKPFHYYDKTLITSEFVERLENVCAVREEKKPRKQRALGAVHVPRVQTPDRAQRRA